MKKTVLFWSYVLTSVLFTVFSYGFVDKNLTLSGSPVYRSIQLAVTQVAYNGKPVAAFIYFLFILIFFLLYRQTYILVKIHELSKTEIMRILGVVFGILIFAYSLVSYDIFNYMTTAKLLYTHHENPYIVMPVEIPNDPNLTFTRAANKVALYGPTWILLSGIPHFSGFGNVWTTMIAFKLFAALWLAGALLLIYKSTHQWSAVVFFGLNPLILIETVVSGHNDIVMMALTLAGFMCIRSVTIRNKVIGWAFFLLSVFVKGATAVLLPLLFIKLSTAKLYRVSFWLMLIIFIIFTPLREELYPWYAVWFFLFAVLLPGDTARFERGLTVALSIGLELRSLPYIYMGYYAGPGPALRTLLTAVPVVIFLISVLSAKRFFIWNVKK